MNDAPIVLFQPYYDRPGHFRSFTDRIQHELEALDRDVYVARGRKVGADRSEARILEYNYRSDSKLMQIGMSIWGLHRLSQWLGEFDRAPVLYLLDIEFVSLTWYLKRFPTLLTKVRDLVVHVHNLPDTAQESNGFLDQLRQTKIVPALQYLDQKVGATFLSNGIIMSRELKQMGVTAENVHPSSWGSELSPKKEISKQKNTFLMLGIWREEKNIPMVLKAFASVSEPCKLTIAGYPRDLDRSTLESLIEHLTLEQHEIQLIDEYLDQNHYSKLLDDHQFLLLPYATAAKSSSGPLLDGMMRNCIPIITDGGERARIVREEQIGYVLPSVSAEALAGQISEVLQSSQQNSNSDKLNRIHTLRNTFKWPVIIKKWVDSGVFGADT